MCCCITPAALISVNLYRDFPKAFHVLSGDQNFYATESIVLTQSHRIKFLVKVICHQWHWWRTRFFSFNFQLYRYHSTSYFSISCSFSHLHFVLSLLCNFSLYCVRAAQLPGWYSWVRKCGKLSESWDLSIARSCHVFHALVESPASFCPSCVWKVQLLHDSYCSTGHGNFLSLRELIQPSL